MLNYPHDAEIDVDCKVWYENNYFEDLSALHHKPLHSTRTKKIKPSVTSLNACVRKDGFQQISGRDKLMFIFIYFI